MNFDDRTFGGHKTGTMRVLDKRPRVTRRGFLKSGGLAAIGVTVVSGSTLLLSPRDALAQSFTTLGPDVGKTLLRMARDIYPHDKLSEKYYLEAVAPYEAAAAKAAEQKVEAAAPDATAAKNAELKKLITDGVAGLNAAANKRFAKDYADIPSEEDRVALLKEMESSPFFQKIRGDLVTGLYNNKAVWPLLGYEGSSWEQGGYINRGFNDINWI